MSARRQHFAVVVMPPRLQKAGAVMPSHCRPHLAAAKPDPSIHERKFMQADLFLRKVPEVVRELVIRQASENRRSINQEAIALLEEALLSRFEAASARRPRLEELQRFVDSNGGELDAASVSANAIADPPPPLPALTSSGSPCPAPNP